MKVYISRIEGKTCDTSYRSTEEDYYHKMYNYDLDKNNRRKFLFKKLKPRCGIRAQFACDILNTSNHTKQIPESTYKRSNIVLQNNKEMFSVHSVEDKSLFSGFDNTFHILYCTKKKYYNLLLYLSASLYNDFMYKLIDFMPSVDPKVFKTLIGERYVGTCRAILYKHTYLRDAIYDPRNAISHFGRSQFNDTDVMRKLHLILRHDDEIPTLKTLAKKVIRKKFKNNVAIQKEAALVDPPVITATIVGLQVTLKYDSSNTLIYKYTLVSRTPANRKVITVYDYDNTVTTSYDSTRVIPLTHTPKSLIPLERHLPHLSLFTATPRCKDKPVIYFYDKHLSAIFNKYKDDTGFPLKDHIFHKRHMKKDFGLVIKVYIKCTVSSENKQQFVFMGPSGLGKTYVANALYHHTWFDTDSVDKYSVNYEIQRHKDVNILIIGNKHNIKYESLVDDIRKYGKKKLPERNICNFKLINNPSQIS